jgi:hypothetical protein
MAVLEKVFFVRELLHLKGSDGAYLIRENGDSLLFTDVDVLPLGFYARLTQTWDMVFMQEQKKTGGFVNTGFYLWRNSNTTRRFAREWAGAMVAAGEHSNDQAIANGIVTEPRFGWNHGIWDKQLDGMYFGAKCAALFDVPRNESALYLEDRKSERRGRRTRCAAVHAIGVTGTARKLGLLADAWQQFSGKKAKTNGDGCVRASYGPPAFGGASAAGASDRGGPSTGEASANPPQRRMRRLS